MQYHICNQFRVAILQFDNKQTKSLISISKFATEAADRDNSDVKQLETHTIHSSTVREFCAYGNMGNNCQLGI